MYNRYVSEINVVGGSCIDLLMKNVDEERFFSGRYKVESIKTSYGGDALNESSVLRHFHKDVKLITIVGDDSYGDLIISYLKEKGIAFNSNIRKKDTETYISFVFIDRDGQRKFVGNENGSLRVLDLSDIVIDEDCRYVSFASLFLSKMLDNEKLSVLFRKIKEKGITLFVDSSNHKNDETINDMTCLKYADYFFCNEAEASQLCQSSDIWQCQKKLYLAGIKNVIIKCGEKGCFYKDRYYPTEKIECIDSTGAGDSFAAGFIKSISENKTVEEAIMTANRFGTSACRYIGTTAWLEHI